MYCLLKRLKVAAVAATTAALTACTDGPSCDQSGVAEQLKPFIIRQSGTISTFKNLDCMGGCVPFIDGENIQFHTLELAAARPRASPMMTFSIPVADFIRAQQIILTNVRTTHRDTSIKRVACAASIKGSVDYSIFDMHLLGSEIQLFRNFDGRVTGWNGAFGQTITVREQLGKVYNSVRWSDPIRYTVQYTNDGKLFVEVGD